MVKYYKYEELEPKTEYLVEGDNFDIENMYRAIFNNKYSLDSPLRIENWGRSMRGPIYEVGEINGQKINVYFNWVVIDGIVVCNYWCDSDIVSWSMIESFLDKKFKGVQRTHRRNFGRVLDYIYYKKQQEQHQQETKHGRESPEEFLAVCPVKP
jgi:hypothetical protein